MAKHPVETEFMQKYGNTGEPICATNCPDGYQYMGRPCTTENVVITYVYLFFSQPARSFSDPTEQTIQSHFPRGGARDAVCLSFKPEHSGHDLLPTKTPEKCIEQDQPLYIIFVDFTKAFDTVAADEEMWMPQKVHHHDRKSAYRNDSQRQEWSVCLGYICYNKQCQDGVHTGSHIFLYFSISNAGGVYIQSLQNVDLFTVAHFREKTKTTYL